MIQFLNNIWITLNSENVELINSLLIPGSIIENLILMLLFLTFLNVNSSKKQKFIYISSMTIVSIINFLLLETPFNILLNYTCMFILIKLIFKLNWLKSFIAFLVSISTFVLLTMLLQNIYTVIFNVNSEIISTIPIHKILFIIFTYLTLFILCITINKLKTTKFNLGIFDNLDRKTIIILIINLCIGFLTLCLQLITSAFYSDIAPLAINVLNFILLLSFLLLNIYSITRIIKLSTTRRDLASAEEYNKSLEILYDNVKGFNHDFNNIVSTLDGFIENNDLTGLKEYFKDVKKDCKITNNLSILNPRIINNPGIYSLLNNKYFKATNLGISVDLDFFLDLNTLPINTYEFSRILGILLDNAIEEAEKCQKKIIKISFLHESRNKRSIISIKNTYTNKDVNTEKIFNKGLSGKANHSGIGLWEVRNYISKNKNLDLYTSKSEEFFSQELYIYDL